MCGETYVGALFSVRGAKRHGEMPCVHSVSPLVGQHVAPLVTVVGKSYNIHRHQHVVATRLNFVFLLLTKRATDSFFDLLNTESGPHPDDTRKRASGLVNSKRWRFWEQEAIVLRIFRTTYVLSLVRLVMLDSYDCLFRYHVICLLSWSWVTKHKPRNLNV